MSDDKKSGRPSLDSDLHPARLDVDGKEANVRRIIDENPRITVRAMQAATGMSIGTIENTLQKLKIVKLCSRWVPHTLSQHNMNTRLELATQNQQFINDLGESFFERILTADESWFMHDNPLDKMGARYWKVDGAPCTARHPRSQVDGHHLL
jgi:histone-lysine N-methyltransferase SETMAR